MVEVIFNGQIGNNLFQYFLGRCIAKEKNYKIGYKKISNESNSIDLNQDFLNFNGLKLPKYFEGVEINHNVKIFKDHIFDWQDINEEGKIVLEGFFQNYKFYKDYKNFIKNEIYFSNNLFETTNRPGKNDIVLHLRLNNYPWKIDVSFYEKILTEEKYEKIWLVTDEPTHADINYLKQKFNCDVLSSTVEGDFIFLINSTKIVMSQSTFCWWAAFLSNAETIYYPLVQNRNHSGIWFENPWINIDLFVDDEERYKKIII
jgi:hypothetical protein